MKIAIRMDDITADMNWKNFLALKELFDRHGICPVAYTHLTLPTKLEV